MDIVERHRRASDVFGDHVRAVGADQWALPTPCDAWDVRSLVNHLVYENLWAVELFAGHTVDEVGDRFEGDLLGDDPVAAWEASAVAAWQAVDSPGAMERIVHLSFGDFPGAEYAEQLTADLLIHGWDLARAVGRDEHLEPTLVAATAAWFANWEEGYRAAGAIGPAVATAPDADAAARLLTAFGRDPSSPPR